MDFSTARRKMVDNQVRPNGVTDLRLVAAMLDIPRERFVPADLAAMAYAESDLKVDEGEPDRHGRFMLEPMVLARLVQAADVRETDRVLDVACGTGYSSAVLARLAQQVIALEDSPARADRARSLLEVEGIVNATVVTGPLDAGWLAEAPFDVILVNGTVEVAPEKLFGQMKDGGRLVAVVGSRPVERGTLYERNAGDVSSRPVFDATAPVLAAFAKPNIFVF